MSRNRDNRKDIDLRYIVCSKAVLTGIKRDFFIITGIKGRNFTYTGQSWIKRDVTMLRNRVNRSGYSDFIPVVIQGFYRQKMGKLRRGTGPRLLSNRSIAVLRLWIHAIISLMCLMCFIDIRYIVSFKGVLTGVKGDFFSLTSIKGRNITYTGQSWNKRDVPT